MPLSPLTKADFPNQSRAVASQNRLHATRLARYSTHTQADDPSHVLAYTGPDKSQPTRRDGTSPPTHSRLHSSRRLSPNQTKPTEQSAPLRYFSTPTHPDYAYLTRPTRNRLHQPNPNPPCPHQTEADDTRQHPSDPCPPLPVRPPCTHQSVSEPTRQPLSEPS
jgi:hypothetical protein